ncbi:MAG: hypothetical protein QG588_172, partial [Candidatus Poribacteria bacterium]|nr:hypothetical protein [Candidatus Poribacteria bacterium]
LSPTNLADLVPPITFRRATEEQSNGRTELGE